MIFLCTHVKRHSKIGGAHQKNWEEKQCFVKQTKYCRVQICLGDGHYHKSEYTHTHTHTHILIHCTYLKIKVKSQAYLVKTFV